MTVEFKEGTYYLGVWFVGDNHSADWMATVWREAETRTWEIAYRFRYYAGDDPWTSDDRKSGYHATLPPEKTETEVLELVRTLTLPVVFQMASTSKTGHPKFSEVLLRSTHLPDIFACLEKQDWVHMKRSLGNA